LYAYVYNNPQGFIDPMGLCKIKKAWGYLTDDFIYDLSDFVAGFGDIITFGGTKLIRDQWNKHIWGFDIVNYDSGSYAVGKWSGIAWDIGMVWVGGLSGGAKTVFWSGKGAMARAAKIGTTLEKTPIGAILNKSGDRVPYFVWKAASATFSGNAKGVVIKVGQKIGNIWRTIEKPILNWRKIPIKYIP
jgi:hypothetical protein